MKLKQIKNKILKITIEYIIIIIGTAIFALGVHIFILPNHIAAGGLTGISTIINSIVGVPVGILFFIFNIPLLLIGTRFLGRNFLIKTLVSTFFFTLLLDYAFVNITTFTDDVIISALYGGGMIGSGLAIVFSQNGSTGGTDITNLIIKKKFPFIQIGRIVFITDFIIILSAAVTFGSLKSSLYAILTMLSTTFVLDGFLYGFKVGKLLLIVSDQIGEIKQEILNKMQRGVTIIPSIGGYTGNSDKNIIMCACRKNEYFKILSIVKKLDSKAFVIVTDSNEILGEGFRPIG